MVSSASAWRICASLSSRFVASGASGEAVELCALRLASWASSSARLGGAGAALGPFSAAISRPRDFSASGALTCGAAAVTVASEGTCESAEPATTSRPLMRRSCGREAGGVAMGAETAGLPGGLAAGVLVAPAKGESAAIFVPL